MFTWTATLSSASTLIEYNHELWYSWEFLESSFELLFCDVIDSNLSVASLWNGFDCRSTFRKVVLQGCCLASTANVEDVCHVPLDSVAVESRSWVMEKAKPLVIQILNILWKSWVLIQSILKLLNWEDCCFCPEYLWMPQTWNLKSILLFTSFVESHCKMFRWRTGNHLQSDKSNCKVRSWRVAKVHVVLNT